MLFFGLHFIPTVCFVSNIGLLCINFQCWAEKSQEGKGFEKIDHEGSLNLEKEIKVLPDIIHKRDTDDKSGILNLHLGDVPMFELENNSESSNFDMSSDAPYTTPVNRANLYTKLKNSKPSLKSSEKRNNRLSKKSQSKSKSGLDDINGKVLSLDCGCWKLPSVQKSQQKSQETINENLYRTCNVNPADTEGEIKNSKDGVNEMGQNSKNEKRNDYIDTIPKNVLLTEDVINEKDILQKNLLPKNLTGITEKDISGTDNTNLILPKRLTEILQDQNSILKELLLKIDHYDVTGKVSPEANDRRVHLILDIKNIGGRSFDLELNPIFKFKDEYDQSNSNVDKNWVETSDSTRKIDVKMDRENKYLNSYAHNTYVLFPNSDPVSNMVSQIPVSNRYKSSKSPWNYVYRQHNDTPHIIDDAYLSKTNKTNTLKTSSNDILSVTPQFNNYKGYIKSPNYLPYSKLYPKPRYPYNGLQYKYI